MEDNQPPALKIVKACPTCNKTLLKQKKETLWRCYTCKKNTPTIIERPSMAKGTRRNDLNLPVIKRDELIAKLNQQNDQPSKALIAILFVIAPRITEVLRLKKEQIELNTDNPNDPLVYFKNRDILKKRRFGRDVPKHTVPIHYDQEPDLCQTILDYTATLPSGALLFDFTRQKATTIIQKVLGKQYYLHWLRHSGITDMFIRRKWSEPLIVKFLDWSDSRQFGHYTHIKAQELAELTK